MSIYLPNSRGANLDITNELTVKGLNVYDSIMGLSSNFTGLAANIVGTSMTLSGTAEVGTLISNNNIYGGVNGFNLLPKNGTVGLLMYGDGRVHIQNTTNSTSISTGALTVLGGVGIAGNLNVGGSISFTGAVNVGTPTTDSHATTKTYVDTALALKSDTTYVDSLSYLTAGTGLTKTGSTISNNTAQPTITSLGTLTSLACSGNIVSDKPAEPTGSTYSSIQLSAGNYGVILSGGLTQSVGSCWKMEMKNDTTTLPLLSIDGSTPQTVFQQTADSSSVSTGSVVFTGGVGVAKNLYIGENVSCSTTPTVGSHLTNKTYVDSNLSTAGTGLTKTGTTFSVNASQTQVTSVGNLTSLTCLGDVDINNPSPAGSGKTYSNLYVTAGANYGIVINGGIDQGVGSTCLFSMRNDTTTNPIFGIDSSVFSFIQTADSSSSTTGSVVLSGGLGVAKNVYVGGTLSGTTATFSGAVTASTVPSSGDHLCNKTYVDTTVTDGITVPFTTDCRVSGTTFTGASENSFYSKQGKRVTMTIVYSFASSSGTTHNIQVDLPFVSAYNQWCNLQLNSGLFAPGTGKHYIAAINDNQSYALIRLRDNDTWSVSDGINGGNSGVAITYLFQFTYISQ